MLAETAGIKKKSRYGTPMSYAYYAYFKET